MSVEPPKLEGFSWSAWGRRQKAVVLFLGIILALVWLLTPSHKKKPDAPLPWDDADIKNTLLHPDHVQAYDFGDAPSDSHGELAPWPGYVGFHKILQDRGPADAVAPPAAAALLDKADFSFPETEKCLNPGPALRFTRGDQIVDVLVSFDCGTILVVHFQGQREIPAGDMLLTNPGRVRLHAALDPVFAKSPPATQQH